MDKSKSNFTCGPVAFSLAMVICSIEKNVIYFTIPYFFYTDPWSHESCNEAAGKSDANHWRTSCVLPKSASK